MKRLSLVGLALFVLVSCDNQPDGVDPDLPRTGADTPVAAVDQLVTYLNVPDFGAAAALAFPGQAALASLAEGASFGDVAVALADGDSSVAANFWSGFAQGAGSFLIGEVATSDGGTEVVEGVEFHLVSVVPDGGGERVIVLREVDGHHIDLFASFGGGMAARMIQPVERLLITETDDSRRILAELREIVPSLLVAASNSDLLPEVSLDLIRLVEVITRAG